MNMEDKTLSTGLYRHFKGRYYIVRGFLTDCDLDGSKVYYESVLVSEIARYSRTYDNFHSDVPRDRANPTGQVKRFKFICHVDEENMIKAIIEGLT